MIFKMKPMIVAMAVAVPAVSTPVVAQGNNSASLEEVVVTGFRQSLATALNEKRESTGSVDAIFAEDIADFPDQNLAESLQRIPGIAINRDAGEGREITVRGLNSTFTRVQLNGMQAQSLSAGSTGIRTDRGFDFNIFASELFNKLAVHKTTSAQLDEGSLGATVELQTSRALDFDKSIVALNAQTSYNDLSGKNTPRLSGLFSMQNEEGTLGALISAAYSERFVSNNGPQTGRWTSVSGSGLNCSACESDEELAAVRSAQHPRLPRFADRTHDQTRLGITSSFQWEPSEATSVSLDILHSNMVSQRSEPFMQAISLARSGSDVNASSQSDITAFSLSDSGNLIAATIEGVDVRSEYFQANWESNFDQYSLSWAQNLSDDLIMTVLIGTSQSTLDNREVTVAYEHFSDNDERKNITYAENQSGVSYDFTRMLAPEVTYDWDTTNPNNWEKSEFRDRIQSGQSGSDTIRVDLDYAITDNVSVEGGFTKLKYDYSQNASRADNLYSSVQETDGTACGLTPEVTVDDGSVETFGGYDRFIASGKQVLAYTVSGCWPYIVRQSDVRGVVEDDFSVYGQLNFNVDVASMVLRGDVGVRHAKTEVISTGLISGQQAEAKNDYSDTLPSINLALNVTDDVIFRTSAAKVMARPNLGDLTPGGTITIFGDPAVSYGNPLLDPYRATNIDFGAEWYYAEGSMVSLAYFTKDIESFPTTETVVIPWSETGLSNALLGAQVDSLKNSDFEVKRKTSGTGGTLDGVEFQVQQGFDVFSSAPEWVQNFGVIANITLVNSELTYGVDSDGKDVQGPLPGQSDDSSNLTLYWESDKVSTRISMANRGEYYDTFDSRGRVENHRIYESTQYVDASFSYQLTDSLKINLEGINLTNEVAVFSINEADRLLIDTSETGRQISLGVSYRM